MVGKKELYNLNSEKIAELEEEVVYLPDNTIHIDWGKTIEEVLRIDYQFKIKNLPDNPLREHYKGLLEKLDVGSASARESLDRQTEKKEELRCYIVCRHCGSSNIKHQGWGNEHCYFCNDCKKTCKSPKELLKKLDSNTEKKQCINCDWYKNAVCKNIFDTVLGDGGLCWKPKASKSEKDMFPERSKAIRDAFPERYNEDGTSKVSGGEQSVEVNNPMSSRSGMKASITDSKLPEVETLGDIFKRGCFNCEYLSKGLFCDKKDGESYKEFIYTTFKTGICNNHKKASGGDIKFSEDPSGIWVKGKFYPDSDKFPEDEKHPELTRSSELLNKLDDKGVEMETVLQAEPSKLPEPKEFVVHDEGCINCPCGQQYIIKNAYKAEPEKDEFENITTIQAMLNHEHMLVKQHKKDIQKLIEVFIKKLRYAHDIISNTENILNNAKKEEYLKNFLGNIILEYKAKLE